MDGALSLEQKYKGFFDSLVERSWLAALASV